MPGQSCTLIQYNNVHDNNTANTPGEGIAATVPVGTGILISGGRNDTVRHNLVQGNGAWGILLNDYPDASQTACDGGVPFFNPPPPFDQLLGPVVPCYFHSFGTRVSNNRLITNGAFGNDTNGDLANAALDYPIRNCFWDNHQLKRGQLISSPINIEDPNVLGTCSGPWVGDAAQQMALFQQLFCDAFGPVSGACTTPNQYPTQTSVTLLPIPVERGMDNPCDGVPSNSWCPRGEEVRGRDESR
jgi:hypothetical protein